ncbi:hypothetical protein JTE90_021689 [Oedothorax gibbosus]|uniref:Calreticulin n=1 Tax=Oedothorax gibbosus TaxID=931172 RepID=A0AAV6TU52_9ARAC|nr:hypothetical protein JTE90_021689 [Oedothorax gibbosus]
MLENPWSNVYLKGPFVCDNGLSIRRLIIHGQFELDPVVKKTKEEETWSILKEDFMMDAEMQDWDKEM